MEEGLHQRAALPDEVEQASVLGTTVVLARRPVDLVRERGSLMQTLLHDAFDEHPIVGEARGTALIGALEFVAGRDPATPFDPSRKVAARITRRCLELGVITRALRLPTRSRSRRRL